MANISRYLCREYFPALYEEGRGGAESASVMDSFLDDASIKLRKGGTKERAAVLRKFNTQLGTSKFLAGEEPSLADIVVFCEVCQQAGMKLPGNVKQWLKRVQTSVPGLSTIPCPYLEPS